MAEDKSLFWALKDISFQMEAGETLGIVGRNGAGKSTLLKILSRITAPSSGQVKVRGRVGSLLEVGTGFHPELTGRDNVFLNGAILGMSNAEVRSQFDQIVSFSELEKFIDTPVKRYSSGMFVRLAFAVAAFLEPEILILDEVLAVGDMAFRTKCFNRIDELIAGHHTILFVAHDTGAITKFCTNALWLDRGEIRAYGPSEGVVEGYRLEQASSRVAAPEVTLVPQDANGTGEVAVTAIDFCDAKEEPAQWFRCGERCSVRLHCERRRPPAREGTITTGKVVIYDELDSRLFSAASLYGEKHLPAIGDKATLVCEFAKLPLLPGKYRLDYEIFVDNASADMRVSAARFEVLPGRYYGSSRLPTRAGTPLCIDYLWRLE